MKTNLQFKRFVFSFLILILGFGNVWGQITYSGSPTSSGGASCPTTNVTTGVSGTCTSATTFVGNTIKAYVGSISGTNATIYLVKCDGSSFGSGTYYLKTNDVCGTVIATSSISSGSSIPINISLSHTGTQNYRITFTSTVSGQRFYTNNFSIIGTQLQPNLVCGNGTVNPTTPIQGQPATFNFPISNSGAGNYSGTLTMWWRSSSTGTSLGTPISSLNAGASHTFTHSVSSLTSAPGNYVLQIEKPDGTVVCSKNVTVIAQQPNLVCGNGTVNPTTPIQGQPATFNFPISNSGTGNYSGTLTMWWRSSSTGTSLGTPISSLNAGASHTFTHSVSSLTSAPGNYVLQIEKPDGTVVCSKNVTVISQQPNLVCGTATVNPTSPIQGQSATFNFPISNSGTGNYSGTLTMWWRSSTTGTTLGTPISTLNAGASHTFTHSVSSLTSAPGNYVLQIEKPDGTVVCSKNVTVVAPPSCITWTGTPPTGEKLTAAEYLCSNGIIINTQNGTDNANNGIPRELLAKITYLGIYKGNTPNSPAVNFPVPFTDMQGSTSSYLDAIKTLAYLQFSDDTTPFDRDLINFNPNTLIQRKYVVKALAEAFNIAKSTATPSPFTDVNTTDEMYGYIKRFHELGFVTGNTQYTAQCTTGTCFHPDANITREDVFVILYRILIATNITRPTATQLNSLSNYFVPGNNRMATMGKVPGLDQANFNHYQKTSFSIAGRGIPLDFTHTYNSFLTELPRGYFEDGVSGQNFSPLGIGWTHTYNIYAVKVAGYTFGSVTEPDKIMFYYPDGSINIYNYNTNACENIGVYDEMTKATISGGERITITTKGQMKYVFENANNGNFYFIKTIKDRNNNGIKINWTNYISNRYRISSVQEEFNNGATGRSLSFSYISSISPFLQQVTDNSIGRNIQFSVAPTTKSLTSYTDPKGQVTQYTYDDANNYNKSNLLTQILLPKGNKIQNTYVNRKLTSSKTFNQANVATSTTNVNWVPNYSASGYNSSATITDPQGKNTSYTHNTLGNPTQVVAPTGTTTFNNYGSGNNANLPTSLTVNGQSSSISYDSKGNVLNITKNGITNAFTYNAFNDVLTHTDGRGFTTNYSYDGFGNLTSVQRPSGGGTTTISRNSFGQVQSVTNPSGITTQFGFNANGLTNQFSLPLGITTSSTYDNASRLLSTTDANGKTTSFQYDANDNLTQSTDANNQIVQHTYDANDNHLTIVNPKNETQTNTYNFDDDLLASEVFGSHTKSYTYNTDGSLATHTRGNGTFTYSYDNTTGRLTSDGFTTYAYDTRGNITTITNSNGSLTLNYDNNDRITSYSDYYGNTVSYLYDYNNNVTRITYPGNKQVNYVYDAVNRCTSVTDWNNKVTSYTYLTDDRVSKITLPNGTFTDYTYDSAGRMTSTINKKANGTVISSYSYTMDNAGNHLTETITEPSITAGLQTIANETVNYGQYPFNRIQSQGSTNFTHNTAGGITQSGSNSFTYDINDNMLTAPNSTFSYDGAGNRRAKTVYGVNTRYVLSILGMSQVLMETNSSNAVQNYYVYGPTGLLYRVKADNTTYSYYHYDYRGSTTAITNEAQNVTHSYSYDPFGKVLAKTEADANPFQYVGQHGVQYESPTLTFMRARYYDPTTGRFVSEDPVWHLNLYPYADNNPVMKFDPDGRLAVQIFTGTLSASISVILNWEDIKDDPAKIAGTAAGGFVNGFVSSYGLNFLGSILDPVVSRATTDIINYINAPVCRSGSLKDNVVTYLKSNWSSYASDLIETSITSFVSGKISDKIMKSKSTKNAVKKLVKLLYNNVDLRTKAGLLTKQLHNHVLEDILKHIEDKGVISFFKTFFVIPVNSK